MKKYIFYSLIVLVLVFSNSCKKGDEDPFFSLKTRTSRLSGDWTLSSADYIKTTSSQISSSSFHYTYNGTELTKQFTSNNITTTEKYKYSEKFSFNKKGSYTANYIDNQNSWVNEGNWTWVNKNDELKLKNKEAILLTITKQTTSTYIDNYSGHSVAPEDIFIFKKLSNKELVIIFDYTSTDNNTTYIISGTKTYTKD